MVTHASKVITRRDYTLATTVCGRMNARSADGMNVSDKREEVTCKFCLAKLNKEPRA